MARARTETKSIEKHVGQRIRERRILLGLTQQQLADRVGVTYQQAHKYERGINRVSAGRLFHMAHVLGVDVGYSYEGLDRSSDAMPKGDPPATGERQRMCLDVARNFARIDDPKQQEALSQLCRALADERVHN